MVKSSTKVPKATQPLIRLETAGNPIPVTDKKITFRFLQGRPAKNNNKIEQDIKEGLQSWREGWKSEKFFLHHRIMDAP